MEILTILKANIRHKKGAFSSIAILMFIIALALTVIISLDDNIRRNLQLSIDAADTGDFVAFIPDSQYTLSLTEQIKADENVDRIRNVQAAATIDYIINGESGNGSDLNLVQWDGTYSVYNETDDDFLENPPDLKAGEMYLPISFQISNDCKIGDKVQIHTEEAYETFTIKGFVEEPLLGAYVIGIKQVFIAESDYERLTSKMGIIHLLHVFMKEDSQLTVNELKRELNEQTGIIDNSYFTLNQADSINYTNMFTQIGIGILAVFLILLFVIVLIVMGHSVSTGIEMDYVNLGVLKAQGFTKGKIREIFILQYTLSMFIGAVLGIVLAIPFTKTVGQIFQPITGILATAEVSYAKCLLLIVGILLIGGVFIYAKTAKIGKISPVKAISGGHDDVYFNSRIHVDLSKRLLSPSLALRQFTSDKRQYSGTVIIVAILVFFMMSMNILTNCMTNETVSEIFGEVNYDIELTLKADFDISEKEAIKKEIETIVPVTMELYKTNSYLTIDGYDINCQIYEDPEEFKSIWKGRVPLYENEVIITEILAEELKKQIGDTITITYQEKSVEYLICGYFQSSTDVGKVFGMSFEGAERLGEISLSYGIIRLSESEKANEVTDLLNEKFDHILSAAVSEDSGRLGDTINVALKSVDAIIYFVSVVFALIVVQMVCRRTFLKERKDLGIYKAVGFSVTKLRLQFAFRFLLVSMLGSILGIVICLLLSQKLVGMLLRVVGITHFLSQYSVAVIAAPIVLICVCFFVFAYLASRRIRQVDTRELIVE